MKKLIAVVLCLVTLIVSLTSALAAVNNEIEVNKITQELLDRIAINAEELVSGNFYDDGEYYACIIWTEDIDLEPAIWYGID